jgi:hypothetical protein
MASITAVELGADTCVLVRTAVRGGAIHVLAFETLDPAAFPGVQSFTVAVRQAKRALKLPRRCRAVVWGLPDGAGRKDLAVQPLLAPLTDAGLKVERVVSPCNALAALARVKSVRGDGATCWLAINRGGVAIVVVRPGKQLYAYSFAWDSSVGTSGSQARLLQRYSLVAILAPEVKRAIAEARKHGIAVEAVVTCGNLPDLRSLTMPLIEELDMEVETLDSLEGLVVKPTAAERLAEAAPAIRLACAGLLARGTRAWDETRRESVRRTGMALRMAAAAALVLVLGYAWYMRGRLPAVSALLSRAPDATPASSKPAPAVSVAAKKPESNPKTPESNPTSTPVVNAKSTPPAPSAPAPAVSVAAKKPESKPPAVSVAAKKPESNPKTPESNPKSTPVVSAKSTPPAPSAPAPAVSVAAKKPESKPPAVSVAAKNPESKPPAVSEPAKKPESKPPAVSEPAKKPESKPPAVSEPAPAVSDAAKKPESNPKKPESNPARPRPEVSPPAMPSGLNTRAAPADKPEAARNRPLPALLKDPLPRVTTILVSSDRRFATIENGQIVGIGDVLGRRTVVAIDERTVVFQEPSGVQIRVGLGGRLVAVGRNDR